MKCSYSILLLSALVFNACNKPPAHPKIDPDNLVFQILEERKETFGEVLSDLEKFEVQILYTQIDRDQENAPKFTSHAFRLDESRYFYPASTVKFPAALLALEKLNDLKIGSLTKFASLKIDSAYHGQTAVLHDSTAESGLPSIAHYIKKIMLVSDNDAFNRLYEFVGQRALNERLWKKGYKNLLLTHRLSVGLPPEQNRCTNPMTFYQNDQILYEQALVCNEHVYENNLQGLRKGLAHYAKGELVEEPMDFSKSNFFSLADQQNIMKALFFPSTVSDSAKFRLTDADYQFLYKYMSMTPGESRFPSYDAAKYYDGYVKFFMFGDSEEKTPKHIRVFNKVGMAYGYLTDNAYIVDFENKIEFLLSATIHVNANQTFNDDNYEYDEIGIPFLANLGRAVYEYELNRKREFRPNLERFKVDYQSADR